LEDENLNKYMKRVGFYSPFFCAIYLGLNRCVAGERKYNMINLLYLNIKGMQIKVVKSTNNRVVVSDHSFVVDKIAVNSNSAVLKPKLTYIAPQ
jgi:hypothetical protein